MPDLKADRGEVGSGGCVALVTWRRVVSSVGAQGNLVLTAPGTDSVLGPGSLACYHACPATLPDREVGDVYVHGGA
jgi:hypothetical protein